VARRDCRLATFTRYATDGGLLVPIATVAVTDCAKPAIQLHGRPGSRSLSGVSTRSPLMRADPPTVKRSVSFA